MNARLRVVWTGLCALALCCPMAWGQSGDEVSQHIAPTGTLRAVINLGNPILARQDPATSQVMGVSVDLAQALAQQLKVPLTLIPVTSAAKSVEVVTQGLADVGFFAIDPVRGQGIAFTPPYVVIEGSYLVKNESPLLHNDQVDQATHKVVVGRGSAYDLFLTRTLTQAQLVRAPTSPEVVSFFLAGTYDVAAGVKQQLQADAKNTPGVRLLPGHFMLIEQAMGQPSSRSAQARETLARFVATMKSNGFVRNSLQRHRIEGAVIAP